MTIAPPPCGLYVSKTVHARPDGRTRFSYRLFSILIDVDNPTPGGISGWLFGVNKPGLLAFYSKDHGDHGGTPLRAWVEHMFERAGSPITIGTIRLLTMPRVLGFVFNPISVFFVYSPANELCGVLYEVHNTFGEKHCYVASITTNADLRHTATKRFHVSPFFGVTGEYQFRLHPPDPNFQLRVAKRNAGTVDHIATWSGDWRPLTSKTILLTWLKMPVLTFWVVFSIHFQALRLWLRGAKYHSKPKPPTLNVTSARRSEKSDIV